MQRDRRGEGEKMVGAVSEQSQVTHSFSFFEVGDIFFMLGQQTYGLPG